MGGTEIYEVPNAGSTDKHGQRPLTWTVYDGLPNACFDPNQPNHAGWGVAVYDATDTEAETCLFSLYVPILLDPDDQQFLAPIKPATSRGVGCPYS